MNMFARFDENPAMTLRVIKETKRYGRTHGRTDNVKTVYPLQTKFAGGITKRHQSQVHFPDRMGSCGFQVIRMGHCQF